MQEDVYWAAPLAAGPVHATVTVPGSKSLANRALMIAAGAIEPSTISRLPAGSRDLSLMLGALRALGATVTADSGVAASAPDTVMITPGTSDGEVAIDCGLAGTVMRFVPPAAALTTATVRFDGDARARERPMGPMIGSLAELGIGVASTDGRLPFTVEGTGRVPGGELVVDASASSQFVTALLLSAARFDDGLTLRHRGGPVPSLPHIDMTVRMLADSGVAVACDTTDRRHCVWRVDPGPIAARDRRIEPDLSNATPFVALAIATGGTVVISDWPADSLQPAEPVVDVFGQLGADFAASPQGMTVTGTGRIRGIDRDLRDLGELIPTIAALCALADSPSQLRGIGHIAGHETNRLTALAADLSGLGADVTTDDDSLTIRPAPLHGGSWRTYHDHRMATCGAILGSVVADIRIENVTTTAKTFPAFPTAWRDAVATGEGGHATAEGGHATAEGGQ